MSPSNEQAAALLRTLETVNKACNSLSRSAFESEEFRRFPLQKLFYSKLRAEFPLTAQIVIRLISKVADAYKIDHEIRREFRPHGSISYDLRVLSWSMAKESVSIWSVDGRLSIPFVCGEHHRGLLAFQRGETDLIYRDGIWFLFTTVDVPDKEEDNVVDWIGVDIGLVAIAHTSDGERFSGSAINNHRERAVRLRRKLQKKGTRSAKRLMRRRRRKERRFATDVNHQISKKIVGAAKRTGRGIALENLKGIRSRVRANKAQRRRLHSWPFAQVMAFIFYKAKLARIPVMFIDPRNTSRTCPKCGNVDKLNRKSQSEFLCVACGYADNADSNAAENIRRAAVNRPYVAGVDVSSNHATKRSLVTSPLLSRGSLTTRGQGVS